MKTFLCIIFVVFSSSFLLAQNAGESITITGDSLVGKILNGEAVREVYGNVVIHQGDVVITCNKALQYISKNNAFLEGNVVVKQDTLTIKAPEGYYYGDEKIAKGNSGVTLDDGNVILTAINGDYYFNEDKAFFSDSVKLYDTVSTLTSNQLTYFKNEQKAIAVGNVTIKDSINIIKADSLVHFRDDKITYAENNIMLSNFENNTTIFGNHLENYSNKNYTLVTRQPLLLQIDSTEDGTIDSLLISAIKMESYNDASQTFIATDSVKIIRAGLASKNQKTIYYRNQNIIETYKIKEDAPVPILWYEYNQFSGDSINIFISSDEKGNRLKRININNNAFILSNKEGYESRFDQISGNTVIVHFDSTEIKNMDVNGNFLSIYYMYDNNEANGLTKASSQNAKILFNNNEVDSIKLYIQPVSEYYPENLVKGNELSFTLPSFKIYKNRPVKEDLLKIDNTRINAIISKMNLNSNTVQNKNE